MKLSRVNTLFVHASILCGITLGFCMTGTCQGDLMVMPKRVVFEGNKRYEDLTVANIGNDTATYVISFVQVRMKQDGSFEMISTPDSAQFFSDKNVRYFPRSVTLGPNEAQTVKIQVTKKDQLGPGEYRSHLYFRAVPKVLPLEEKPVTDSSISIQLIPIYGISIPVILRLGLNDSGVSFAEASFKVAHDTLPLLTITFNRKGNMSVYGNVMIDHVSLEGKVTRVARVNGVAVYTPNTIRNMQVVLDHGHGVNYHSGKLHVTYSDQSSKNVTLAEQDVALH